VTLIAGPVHLETPKGVDRVDVVSAKDMLAALKVAFRDADGLIMAAAVADYRPARRHRGKWRKSDQGDGPVTLELVENPDLLATVGRSKGERCIMGFALETSRGLARARVKMERKNADFVVLNGASALNADASSVTLIDREGGVLEFGPKSKGVVAKRLVAAVEDWVDRQRTGR
ncbi:MAG: bifunctional 4'-phosphopantothenoylcysteine decarboxylase/phosphopantothenoylcysteine synthetase, partial [Planctomycetes bacterium]|nr:bifunctional 4'-phosphopantothenoylcysteine decarboxylase/phosphopantothenoylcysteine synthetase [Planctomycetota bacterium]